MKRYTGEIFWIKVGQAAGEIQSLSGSKIKRAILNDNILKIDHDNPEEIPSSEIRLRSKDGYEFKGSAKYIDSPRSSALVNFFYYTNKDKAFLRGEWVEDKIPFVCFAQLNEVENFEN